MKKILKSTLIGYKTFISPFIKSMFGGGCRFTPTCSEYSVKAMERFGIIKGTYLSVFRILRCNPFTKSQTDDLPKEFSFRKLTIE
jgi:hypothetical protein